jgi:sugar phosphate isomerase/epimerase
VKPKLAACNFIPEPVQLKQFALKHGFDGIDWSIDLKTFPRRPKEESALVQTLIDLQPLEVRYHCPYPHVDIGHTQPSEANKAKSIFERTVRLVSKAGGQFMTIHIGLGHDTTHLFSWQTAVENLRDLVQFGADHGVKVCLENLAWGWTSKPNLLEKLIRRTGAGMTFDIGHARVCEAVQTQYYALEDFITPHLDKVYNAHVYHTEVKGIGHLPPEKIADIADRLGVLLRAGCNWWVIEIKEAGGLLQTKQLIDTYLEQIEDENNPRSVGRSW